MDILSSNTPQKQCTKCGQTLPFTLEYFSSNGKNKLRPNCRECERKRNKERYYIPEVHEKALTSRKLYREQNSDKVKVQRKVWSEKPESKEYKRNYTRQYRTRPGVLEKKHANDHEYMSRPDVKARRLAYGREYLQLPEKRARHQERDRANHHMRRARNRAVAGIHTSEQIQQKLQTQKYRCYYCSAKFEKKAGKYLYHVDHTFPLSRVAGTDIPANDINYLVLACQKCNISKNDRFPWEFPEGGRLL